MSFRLRSGWGDDHPMKHSRLPTSDDPELRYHLSDRDFNRRTYYMVLGLYLVIVGSTGAMWFMKLPGLP